MLTTRPLSPGDDEVVRQIFWSTFRLGQRLGGVPRMRRYEDLCLGWYLGPERRHVRLLVDGERAVGYVLVGTRGADHARWTRRRAVEFGLWAVAGLALGRHPPDAVRFLRLRLTDGWALRRAPRPMPVHVHLNLLTTARGGVGRRKLLAHVDDVCRGVASPGWFGEINAVVGRRTGALERLGGQIVHRAPNRTLTAIVGRPVERLTIVRQVAPSGAVPA